MPWTGSTPARAPSARGRRQGRSATATATSAARPTHDGLGGDSARLGAGGPSPGSCPQQARGRCRVGRWRRRARRAHQEHAETLVLSLGAATAGRGEPYERGKSDQPERLEEDRQDGDHDRRPGDDQADRRSAAARPGGAPATTALTTPKANKAIRIPSGTRPGRVVAVRQRTTNRIPPPIAAGAATRAPSAPTPRSAREGPRRTASRFPGRWHKRGSSARQEAGHRSDAASRHELVAGWARGGVRRRASDELGAEIPGRAASGERDGQGPVRDHVELHLAADSASRAPPRRGPRSGR